MDNLQKAYYEQQFGILFRDAKGDAFQTLFERLMGLAYPKDFMACRPWGNRGDRKNDGFLKSERCLFQVYAPNEMSERVAKKKIKEDFEDGKKHWGEHFNKWVFAHNAVNGLPPHIQQMILNLEKANPGITLQHWGLNEFLKVFRKVSKGDRELWLGYAPSNETKAQIGFADLQPILESLGNKSAPKDYAVRDVPTRKIEANALSENVAILLKTGMEKAALVGNFFMQWPDETLGEQIAEAFRDKYKSLHSQKSSPDVIFSELQQWAGGEKRGIPKHEMAIFAVIAYFFDSCDIFEEPRSQTP